MLDCRNVGKSIKSTTCSINDKVIKKVQKHKHENAQWTLKDDTAIIIIRKRYDIGGRLAR